MNKSLLLLVAGVLAYYLYEKSQVGATNNPNCPMGTVFVNGQCVSLPTTTVDPNNTSFPCAPGFTNVQGTGCVANPGNDVSSNPIGDLLQQLI